MVKEQVIGLDVLPGVGQRVIMANTRDRWRGEGAISSVHASGSYCGVQWDSGHLDLCLFSGMQNEYHLVAANCVGQDGSGHLLPLDQVTAKAALPEGYDLWLPRDDTELQESFSTYAHRSSCLPCERLRAESRVAGASYTKPRLREFEDRLSSGRDHRLGSAAFSALESYTTSSLLYEDEDGNDLQKLILAQEVVKLRAEVARLEAQKVHAEANEGAAAAVRDEILILQARKAQTIEQREIDKKLLKNEIQKLLQEVALISGVQQSVDPKASGWKDRVQHAHDLEAHELDALHLLVDQAASEHEFVLVLLQTHLREFALARMHARARAAHIALWARR